MNFTILLQACALGNYFLDWVLIMLEIFPQPEKWDLLNNKLKNKLHSDSYFRAYNNPYLACYDLVIGLAQLYAHKRSLAWIKGLSPFFDSVYSYFVREGYHIQAFTLDELQSQAATLPEFVEKLKKDTLFFFHIEDHPITGELYNYGELENILSHKKIFSISVSHQSHLYKKKSMYPLGARVCWFDKNLTGIYLGEKFKVNSILGPFQNFSELSCHPDWEIKLESWKSRKELQKPIVEFEKSFPNENLIQTSERIWDRSLLIFKEVHADELAYRLNQLGFPQVQALSTCHSGSVKMLQKWPLPAIEKEAQSGMLLLKYSSAADIPGAELIRRLVQEIQNDSQWEY